MSKASEATRFQPGDPDGRAAAAGRKSKRGPSIRTEIIRQLETGEVNLKAFVHRIFAHAADGDASMTRLIFEALDSGKFTHQEAEELANAPLPSMNVLIPEGKIIRHKEDD